MEDEHEEITHLCVVVGLLVPLSALTMYYARTVASCVEAIRYDSQHQQQVCYDVKQCRHVDLVLSLLNEVAVYVPVHHGQDGKVIKNHADSCPEEDAGLLWCEQQNSHFPSLFILT